MILCHVLLWLFGVLKRVVRLFSSLINILKIKVAKIFQREMMLLYKAVEGTFVLFWQDFLFQPRFDQSHTHFTSLHSHMGIMGVTSAVLFKLDQKVGAALTWMGELNEQAALKFKMQSLAASCMSLFKWSLPFTWGPHLTVWSLTCYWSMKTFMALSGPKDSVEVSL